MTVRTILPYNQTDFEGHAEQVLRDNGELNAAVAKIMTCKESPSDDWLPWLIWEYGLEELMPYFSDQRELLDKGLKWQRIRGTPASVDMIFDWAGLGNAVIEEEDPTSAHWFEVQVDIGYVPNGNLDIKKMIDALELSLPVGIKLARIYHGYDFRRFILNQSDFTGQLLSDYSGWRDPETGIVLSFGRDHDSFASLDDGGTSEIFTSNGRERHSIARYEDRPLLDFSMIFGELPQLVYRSTRLHIVYMIGGEPTGPMWQDVPWQDVAWNSYPPIDFLGQLHRDQRAGERLTISKAAIPLDDGWALGDTNSVLFAREQIELGGQMVLSGDVKFGDPWKLVWQPIDERFERAGSSICDSITFAPRTSSTMLREHNTGTRYTDRPLLDHSMIFGELPLPVDASAIEREQHLIISGGISGPAWIDAPWLAASWIGYGPTYLAGAIEVVGQLPSESQTIPVASVQPDDGALFGDFNAAFQITEPRETGGPMILSGGTLLGETAWRIDIGPVDERADRLAASTAVFAPVDEQQQSTVQREHFSGADSSITADAHGTTTLRDLPMYNDYQFQTVWPAVQWGDEVWANDTQFFVRNSHNGDSA